MLQYIYISVFNQLESFNKKFHKKVILGTFQRFVIAPSRPPQWQEGSPSMSMTKAIPNHAVNTGTSVWERDENIQNSKLGSKPAPNQLVPHCHPLPQLNDLWGITAQPGLTVCSSSFAGGWAGRHQNPVTNINPLPTAAAAPAPTGTVQPRPEPPRHPSSSGSSEHAIHHRIRKLRVCQWCN